MTLSHQTLAVLSTKTAPSRTFACAVWEGYFATPLPDGLPGPPQGGQDGPETGLESTISPPTVRRGVEPENWSQGGSYGFSPSTTKEPSMGKIPASRHGPNGTVLVKVTVFVVGALIVGLGAFLFNHTQQSSHPVMQSKARTFEKSIDEIRADVRTNTALLYKQQATLERIEEKVDN